MMIPCGDTLLPSPNQNTDNHLWVVVTDPEGDPPRVVMVNLTSFRPGVDETVILNPGDHPFVRHKTVINYGDARFTCTKLIDKAYERGLATIKQPASAELQERIKNGLLESKEPPKNIKEYCSKNWGNSSNM